jgi:hypothetical protein
VVTTAKPNAWADHARPVPRRRHQTVRAVGRFVAGRDLDGRRRTDARWNKPGTQPLTPTGHASKWAHQPHLKRAKLRFTMVCFTVLTPLGLLIDWQATVTTLRVLACMALVFVGWVVFWEKPRRYMNYKETIKPLGEFLASTLGDARYMLDPRSCIHVPVDVDDRPTRIDLPPTKTFTESQEKTLARSVAARIPGMHHPMHTFSYEGGQPFMELRPAPAPREWVRFSDPDVRALVECREPGHLFLGLGPRDAPQYLDLVKGAPHVGWSMPTNAGKSTAARGPIIQFLYDGGICLILDPKMDSHPWARDLPNVRFCDTPEEIFDGLMWLSNEVDRRNAIGKAHGDIRGNVDPQLIGPKLLVIAEELNSMEIDQATYWRSIRQPGDPLKSPSMTALGRALNMGRAKRVYVFPISQELLVQSLGGPAAKANLSTRILGRADAATWNKLAPQCKVKGRYPKKSMHPGRVYVVTGDEPGEVPVPVSVQTMYVDEQDARDYAMSGIVAEFPADEAARQPEDRSAELYGHDGVRLPRPGEMGELPQGLPHLHAVPELELEGITLAAAAEVLTLNVKTLRNARDRDPSFPDPVETPQPGKPARYWMADLERWAENRPRVVREGDDQ